MATKPKAQGGRARSDKAMTLARRADFLSSHLGFDPRDGLAFRAMPTSIDAPMVGGNLAADPAAAVDLINASPYVREPLTADMVHVHTVEAASTRFAPDRFGFLGMSTVRNIAEDCRRGIAFMTKHATGGDFAGGPGENPYGRTFAGSFEQRPDVSRALAQFYMLRAHNPNGSNAPSTDDLHRGLVGGTLFDFSVGLVRGGRLVCDVCGEELYGGQCPHCPGTTFGMTDEQIGAQAARGIPDGKASFTFEDCHAGEISAVFNGAIPGASTAFSTRGKARALAAADMTGDACDCCDANANCSCPTNDNGMCSCPPDCSVCVDKGCDGSTDMASHQEDVMFTPEFKASIGLLATATDEEVTKKIEEMKLASTNATTLAAENEQLKLAQKTAADAAFVTAWTGKLPDTTIASLKGLPNRDEMAKDFAGQLEAAKAGKTVQAPPPVGDPLKGAGLAAAPVTQQPKEPDEPTRIFMRALGGMTSEKLVKFATLDPITALEKWLSTSGTAVTLTREPLHENFARQTVEHRKAMLGLTQ